MTWILLVMVAVPSFAQNQEDQITDPKQVELEPIISKGKMSTQDRFDEVLSASRSYCGQKYPFPEVPNSYPYDAKDIQQCRRLDLTGKRIECEINFLGSQNAKGNVFAPESLPSLKEWARCSGKVAVLLQEGYFVPTSEIRRRLQFCISQFYNHPGEAPKLGFYDRARKWLSRPDYRAESLPALDTNFFDKSSLRIDDQTGGLLKCEYMMPRDQPRQSRSEILDITPPVIKSSEETNATTKKVAPKKEPQNVKKPPESTVKNPAPQNPPKVDTQPVGECKRPKHDCPTK